MTLRHRHGPVTQVLDHSQPQRRVFLLRVQPRRICRPDFYKASVPLRKIVDNHLFG